MGRDDNGRRSDRYTVRDVLQMMPVPAQPMAEWTSNMILISDPIPNSATAWANNVHHAPVSAWSLSLT